MKAWLSEHTFCVCVCARAPVCVGRMLVFPVWDDTLMAVRWTVEFKIFTKWRKSLWRVWSVRPANLRANWWICLGATGSFHFHSPSKNHNLKKKCFRKRFLWLLLKSLEPESIQVLYFDSFVEDGVCSTAVKPGGRMNRWKAWKKRKHVGNCRVDPRVAGKPYISQSCRW